MPWPSTVTLPSASRITPRTFVFTPSTLSIHALLSGAITETKNSWNVVNVPLGFDGPRVVTMTAWISAAKYPAVRLEFFGNDDLTAGDLFRPTCTGCGALVPASLLGVHYDLELCPRCKDAASPFFLTGLARAAV